jgi:putative hemolysin
MAAETTPGDPFTLQIAHAPSLMRAVARAARPILERALALDRLRGLYDQARSAPGATFDAHVLRALDVRYRIDAAGGGGIPADGPLIVAANHPTGAVDGLVLAAAVRQVRTDVRILANHWLSRIPELHDTCFFVDPFGGPAAASRSRAGLREALLWLRRGGALVLFPAGEVTWRFTPGDAGRGRRLVEPRWEATMGRLAAATGASVLPAFLDGRNSRLFYQAGRLHPVLRTLLLGRELLNARGRTVRVAVGPAFPGRGSRSEPAATPESVTDAARLAVESLRDGCRAAGPAPIEPPISKTLLAQDVEALAAEDLLLRSGSLDVFCAHAAAIPHVLREIGRLRETTFRAAGEGTGRATDLDRFDGHYQHLFVWERTKREVVGAYRLGATDVIVSGQGVAGLYTSTLFRYDDEMLRHLGPALELGRSFVRAEYQRSYSPLLLLWKGIGRLVAREPRYRMLFGAVSISSRYQETSQQCLRAFLAQEHTDASLAGLVQPIHPPPPLAPPARDAVRVADIESLDALIRRLEGTQGVPVLLRQYLRLNATLLGFNVDPAFGDALDALMKVDLTQVPAGTLRRYLGRDADAFLASHGAGRQRSGDVAA